MTENKAKELCLKLMRADTEDAIIELLKKAGYWDNQNVWRYFGDRETNYNTIGNQQSRPDAALVEKLVNSVDARLMNECLAQRVNPESPDAPQGIQEAVARFFDSSKGATAGRIRDWTTNKRTEVARGIALTATGARGNPSFTISDAGEGQTPSRMPHTLLSLDKDNKLKIPFVQGKFNMGGTGALKFCGKHNLQLVVSRRSPVALKYLGTTEPDDDKWSFTVVRREDPLGNRRSSVYTYLAPYGAETQPSQGGVLRFASDEMPIFPNGQGPYSKNASWGTLIKLYEYSATGFKSHILMKDGLLSRIDLLLPDVALPMRFHECRDYKGHEGSFETTLTGVRVRLEDDKGQNLEEGFPSFAPTKVLGEEMLVSIYAFKKKRGEAYRKNEGIVFVVNGQTHGHLTQDFFSRKSVGLSYLSDSILVIVDCSKLSGRAREDLFMNSRDRLSGGELRMQIEESLEELLKQHTELRALKERRRREEIESKLDDSRPLEDILARLLKNSPTLSNLFLQGIRATNPFKTAEVQAQEQEFKGKRFPTYFKFKGKEYGHVFDRECHINMRCRLIFETDAENDYFSRATDPGEFLLVLTQNGIGTDVQNFILNLQNGIASLSLSLPEDSKPSQVLRYKAVINDCSRIEPFTNEFEVTLKEAKAGQPREHHADRRKPPSKEKGEDRENPSGIQLPNIKLIEEGDWEKHNPPFDKYTALRIRNAGISGNDDEESANVYDFYINRDNLYLKTELKSTKSEPELVRAQFTYGMVLLGMALIQQDITDQDKEPLESEEENGRAKESSIEKKVEEFSRAIAPMVVPMINSLGSLSLEDESVMSASGEAT